ncbi:phage baseplate assembly protein V [Lunatibacter salilacus]|uniref:phage baseplate assembly protein V n=1 Tax=Lunatibacter salilacus TaxID=2483804 RepID=UPI00131A8383|nr:phage baseplate assembly protein V [Lunatibacter salilacus]
MEEKYYGKYRGVVKENIDPEKRGRILVKLPDVTGLDTSSWAMPCVPIAGPNMGTYFVPIIDSWVWVEFEAGNLDYPIWIGGFWENQSEVPELALAGIPESPNIVLQTAGQNSIVLSDFTGSNGGIMLKSANGASIIVNDEGIYIENGKGASIIMKGTEVAINRDGMVIN